MTAAADLPADYPWRDRPHCRLTLTAALAAAQELGLPVGPFADRIAGLAVDVSLRFPAELLVEAWEEDGYDTELDALRAEDADAVLAALATNDRDGGYEAFALAVGAQCRELGAILAEATVAAYLGTAVLRGETTLVFGPAADSQPCPAALAGRAKGDWTSVGA